LFAPSDTVEAVFSYDTVDDQSNYPQVVNLSSTNNGFCRQQPGSQSSALPVPGRCLEDEAGVPGIISFASGGNYDYDAYDVDYSATPFKAAIESDLISLNVSVDLSDELTFESITGYQDVKDRLTGEVTGIPDVGVPVFFVDRQQVYDQFSQELRLTSDYSGAFNFVAGLYYFESEYSMQPQEGLFFQNKVFEFNVSQRVEAMALFAEAYYELSPELRLTIGGRYTKEEKEYEADRTAIEFANPTNRVEVLNCPDPQSSHIPCQEGVEDWSRFTPRLSVDYKITDDLMAYASYSQGFRSGGWVGRAALAENIGTYEPEILDSLEAGIRSEWFDNTLRFNATVFTMDYQDKQEDYTVAYVDPFGSQTTDSRVENGAAATVNGLEVELQYSATPDLVFRSALGLLDAEYDEYIEDGINIADQKHYRFAPETTFSLGADYFFEVAGSELVFTTNFKHTAEFWVTPNIDPLGLGRDKIDSNNQLDMSINASINNWKVSIFGNNLTQSDGRLFRKFDAGAFHFGDKEAGRTFGINLGVEF